MSDQSDDKTAPVKTTSTVLTPKIPGGIASGGDNKTALAEADATASGAQTSKLA